MRRPAGSYGGAHLAYGASDKVQVKDMHSQACHSKPDHLKHTSFDFSLQDIYLVPVADQIMAAWSASMSPRTSFHAISCMQLMSSCSMNGASADCSPSMAEERRAAYTWSTLA